MEKRMTAPQGFYEGLGASLCACILGEDKFKSPYTLWREFLNPEERPNLEENEAVEAGIMLEPSIAQWAAKKLGVKIEYQPGRLLKHPTIPFMQCHPDAMVVGETAGLEVKNRGFNALKTYAELANFEDDMDRAQPGEVLQCHASMAVTGASHWYLGVAVAGQKLLPFKIQRDGAIIEAIESRYAEFWDLVQRREPPPPINLDDCQKRWPHHVDGKFVSADADVVALVEQYRKLKKEAKVADESADFAAFKLKALMADAEEIRYGGKKILSWKTQTRNQFQLERFRTEQPAIAAEFTEEKSMRVLR